ncbi:MAG TPA: NIPSNAP family protein [Caulifigura sp.]|nr:NIPSNAP family protein [Caulifigura sp.]
MSSIRTSLFACVAGLALGALAMNQTGSIAAEPQSEGLYELRTYTAAEGKLEALEARFKNHTVKLFEKHGMKNIMYWIPTDAEKSKNTLIYLLWHKSEDAAKKSWADFRNDPDWMKAKAESEKDGSLTAPKGVVSVYMKATEWSPKGIR